MEKYYFKNIKLKKNVKIVISQAIQNIRINGILERCNDMSGSKEFLELVTVSCWQSQLRGNKMKNSNASNLNSTKSQYQYHL